MRRLPDALGPIRAGTIATVATASGSRSSAVWQTAVGLVVGAVVIAVGSSFLYPSLLLLVLRGVPENQRGSVVGTFSAFFDFASGAAGIVLGGIAALSSYQGAFAASAVLAAVALVLLRSGFGRHETARCRRSPRSVPATVEPHVAAVSGLLVTNDFPPKIGGIQSYLYELWRRLPVDDATVLTTRYDGDRRGTREQRVPRRARAGAAVLPDRVAGRRIDALAREIDAPVILLDPWLPLGQLGPRLRAAPYVVVVHGAEVTVPGRLPGSRQLGGRGAARRGRGRRRRPLPGARGRARAAGCGRARRRRAARASTSTASARSTPTAATRDARRRSGSIPIARSCSA